MSLKTVHRWIRRIWVTGGLIFMAVLFWSIQAHDVPASLYESTAALRVETTGYGRVFRPAVPASKAAFVFIPGGLIDPNAYVPLVRAVADAGIPAAIVDVPLRAAPTDSMRATLWTRIELAKDDVGGERPIVLGGHSRGGMFASAFAAERPGELAGLVLFGTTHPRDQDLSKTTWPVVKILGSADCVAPLAESERNRAKLPQSVDWIEIAGANHRQFGYYGWQIGDCAATITREEQHRRVADAIVALVRRVG